MTRTIYGVLYVSVASTPRLSPTRTSRAVVVPEMRRQIQAGAQTSTTRLPAARSLHTGSYTHLVPWCVVELPATQQSCECFDTRPARGQRLEVSISVAASSWPFYVVWDAGGTSGGFSASCKSSGVRSASVGPCARSFGSSALADELALTLALLLQESGHFSFTVAPLTKLAPHMPRCASLPQLL